LIELGAVDSLGAFVVGIRAVDVRSMAAEYQLKELTVFTGSGNIVLCGSVYECLKDVDSSGYCCGWQYEGCK